MTAASSWIRKSAVAGRFYPGDAGPLRDFLSAHCHPDDARRFRRAVMAPHAGFIYSGQIAALAYRQLQIPKTAVILCPNHTGRGERVSVWSQGEWETPLGNVPVNEMLAAHLLAETPIAKSDRAAHLHEHAIEVHLPFLQWLRPDIEIVPVVLGPLHASDCIKLGKILSRIVDEKTLLVASTDMSHYLSADAAKIKDEQALAEVERVDPEGLYRVVVENEISMCGFIPTTSALSACREWGITRAHLVKYGHSGETTGDCTSVVGYASAFLGE